MKRTTKKQTTTKPATKKAKRPKLNQRIQKAVNDAARKRDTEKKSVLTRSDVEKSAMLDRAAAARRDAEKAQPTKQSRGMKAFVALAALPVSDKPETAAQTEAKRRAKHTLHTPSLSYLKNHVRVFGIEKIAKRYGVSAAEVQKRIDDESADKIVRRVQRVVMTLNGASVVSAIDDSNVRRISSAARSDGWRTEWLRLSTHVAPIHVDPRDGQRYIEARTHERADLLYDANSGMGVVRLRKYETSSLARKAEREASEAVEIEASNVERKKIKRARRSEAQHAAV